MGGIVEIENPVNVCATTKQFGAEKVTVRTLFMNGLSDLYYSVQLNEIPLVDNSGTAKFDLSRP